MKASTFFIVCLLVMDFIIWPVICWNPVAKRMYPPKVEIVVSSKTLAYDERKALEDEAKGLYRLLSEKWLGVVKDCNIVICYNGEKPTEWSKTWPGEESDLVWLKERSALTHELVHCVLPSDTPVLINEGIATQYDDPVRLETYHVRMLTWQLTDQFPDLDSPWTGSENDYTKAFSYVQYLLHKKHKCLNLHEYKNPDPYYNTNWKSYVRYASF